MTVTDAPHNDRMTLHYRGWPVVRLMTHLTSQREIMASRPRLLEDLCAIAESDRPESVQAQEYIQSLLPDTDSEDKSILFPALRRLKEAGKLTPDLAATISPFI